MKRFGGLLAVTAAAAVLLSAGAAPAAESTVYTVSQLRNALYGASPGDRIKVAPGSYNGRLWVTDVHGRADAMIEVVALDPANRPVFTSNEASCFTLYNCSYVLVDGIIAEHGGTATNESNNIEFPYGSHMILANSASRYVDHEGNSDGVKFAHSDNILMYNCEVTEWGDGGSAVDQMISRNSLVMRSSFAFPSLLIGEGANGFQPKGESHENGYYKNTFNDGSSRCVQFGGAGGATTWEAWDMAAYGNVIDGGEAALAYVSCTTSDFSYNTIVNPEKWVMRILKEGGPYQTAYNTFKRNLIEYGPFVASGGIQNIGSNTRPETFEYAENYWYNRANPAGSIPSLPGGETDPAGGVDPQLDADYRPQYGPARDYGAHAAEMEAEWAQYTDWFDWAWAKAQQYEPDADAGGEVRIAPGLSITLDGSASRPGSGAYGDHQIVEWLWDIDGDNVFDDAAGETVELSYADLTGSGPGQLGLPAGQHTIELRISSQNPYGVITDWGLGEMLILDELIPGDANVDGTVDYLDLGVLGTGYNQSGTWRDGDFTADGLVTYVDLGILASNYGAGSSGGLASVPAPPALLLLVAAVPSILRRRGTRR